MKFSAALVAGVFASSASAWFGGHAHFHQKRTPQNLEYPCCLNVVTVTVTMEGEEPTSTATVTSTNVNVVTATTSSSSSTTSSTTSTESSNTSVVASPTANVNVNVNVHVGTPSPTSTFTPSPSPAPSSAPSPAAPAASPAAAPNYTPGSCHMVTNGNKWGITYTQYAQGGGCADPGTIMSDLAKIKDAGFTTVRMYGTDCNGLQNIGAAVRANGLKIIVGVFIDGGGIGAAQSQVSDIANWGSAGNWDIVSMIVVGNEAIASGHCDAGSLASFVASAKGAFQAAGSGCIPVTTTEPVNIIVENEALFCPVVDVIAANIETYFNGGVVSGGAGAFAAGQLGQIAALCGGTKAHYNLESGWPSAGGTNGASVASPGDQWAAMTSIHDTIGPLSILFSYQNDYWKGAGIESNFGCLHVFQ